jgi:hypothetical protein
VCARARRFKVDIRKVQRLKGRLLVASLFGFFFGIPVTAIRKHRRYRTDKIASLRRQTPRDMMSTALVQGGALLGGNSGTVIGTVF